MEGLFYYVLLFYAVLNNCCNAYFALDRILFVKIKIFPNNQFNKQTLCIKRTKRGKLNFQQKTWKTKPETKVKVWFANRNLKLKLKKQKNVKLNVPSETWKSFAQKIKKIIKNKTLKIAKPKGESIGFLIT
jgi:hypothetical protein